MTEEQYTKSKVFFEAQLNKQLSFNISLPITDIKDMVFINIDDTKSISSFESISEFPQIEYIYFRNCKTIKNLEGIEKLPKLKGVIFGSKSVVKKGIKSLFKVKTLEELTIPNNFGLLINLQDSVKKLHLNNDSLCEIPKLPQGNSIEILRLGDRKHCLESLKGLSNFKKIKELHISNGKLLKSLDGIEHCNNLKVLWANFTAISDLSKIDTAYLEEIRLRKTNITSLESLYPSPKLKNLYAEKTKLSSIRGINNNMPSLELLWIFDTKIKDITPLEQMVKLKELIVMRLKSIKNWDSINSLTRLETIDLHQTNFSDIDLLCSLEMLKYALLSETKISPNDPKLQSLDTILSSRKGGYSFSDIGQWKKEIDHKHETLRQAKP